MPTPDGKAIFIPRDKVGAGNRKIGVFRYVSRPGSAANFSLTDKAFSVIAENISLTGVVTFADLNDPTSQARINGGLIEADTLSVSTIKGSANGGESLRLGADRIDFVPDVVISDDNTARSKSGIRAENWDGDMTDILTITKRQSRNGTQTLNVGIAAPNNIAMSGRNASLYGNSCGLYAEHEIVLQEYSGGGNVIMNESWVYAQHNAEIRLSSRGAINLYADNNFSLYTKGAQAISADVDSRNYMRLGFFGGTPQRKQGVIWKQTAGYDPFTNAVEDTLNQLMGALSGMGLLDWHTS